MIRKGEPSFFLLKKPYQYVDKISKKKCNKNNFQVFFFKKLKNIHIFKCETFVCV